MKRVNLQGDVGCIQTAIFMDGWDSCQLAFLNGGVNNLIKELQLQHSGLVFWSRNALAYGICSGCSVVISSSLLWLSSLFDNRLCAVRFKATGVFCWSSPSSPCQHMCADVHLSFSLMLIFVSLPNMFSSTPGSVWMTHSPDVRRHINLSYSPENYMSLRKMLVFLLKMSLVLGTFGNLQVCISFSTGTDTQATTIPYALHLHLRFRSYGDWGQFASFCLKGKTGWVMVL